MSLTIHNNGLVLIFSFLLLKISAINERLDAVEDLLNYGLIDPITAFLGKLPDLERSVASILILDLISFKVIFYLPNEFDHDPVS